MSQIKLDIKKFTTFMQARISEFSKEEMHDEDHLCDACEMKRDLWNSIELIKVCNNMAKELYLTDISFLAINPRTLISVILESIIIGIDMGIDYRNMEIFTKKMSEK